jgi:TolA-binding protein
MDRQHRRELKHDKFVDEVGHLTDSARANQRMLYSIGAAAIAIAIAVYGFYFYRGSQETKAQAALAKAIETIESPLIVEASPNKDARFKTDVEKNAVAEKEFKAIQSSYGGTDAADVANIYLARISASRGDIATARKQLQQFIDEHPTHLLVGGARYSLYALRIDGGEAQQVATELSAEVAKTEPVLPTDSLLVLLAQAYETQGNSQNARETYRRIVTEFPDSPFVLEAQRRIGPA